MKSLNFKVSSEMFTLASKGSKTLPPVLKMTKTISPMSWYCLQFLKLGNCFKMSKYKNFDNIATNSLMFFFVKIALTFFCVSV